MSEVETWWDEWHDLRTGELLLDFVVAPAGVVWNHDSGDEDRR